MTVAEPTAAYVTTCLYGLERLLAEEVQERLGVSSERDWCEVIFQYDGDPRRLRDLRLAGNVFVRFDRFQIGPSVQDLSALADRLRALPVDAWERQALAFHDEAGRDISISVGRKGEHAFTYAQVEELALDAVSRGTGRRTTLEDQPLQLRVDIHNEWCTLMGRLTLHPLGVRGYRKCHMRGATEPTLAAAMVRLTEPRGDDVFLDPFCGTGTAAIERALAGPSVRVVAGEVNERRVGWARTNARIAGVDVQFGLWDAAALPFADRTFSAIAAVPPQSEPSGGQRWHAGQFTPFVKECLRVLRFDGTMVWLMQRGGLFPGVLKEVAPRHRAQALPCNWKGRQWTIYRLRKTV